MPIVAFAVLAAGLFFGGGVGKASAANETYYVDASKLNDTGGGTTPATAKKTMSAAIALANDNDGGVDSDVVLVAAGTYAEYALITDIDMTNLTISGCMDNAFTNCTADARELVINQTLNTAHGFFINIPNVTIKNMTIWGYGTSGATKVGVYVGIVNNFTLESCNLYRKDYADYLVSIGGGSGHKIRNNIAHNGGNSLKAGVFNINGSSGEMAYNYIHGSSEASPFTDSSVNFSGGGTWNISNNVVVDAQLNNGQVFPLGSVGTYNFFNNIVFGNSAYTSRYTFSSPEASNVSADNNFMTGGIWHSGRLINGSVDNPIWPGNNVIDQDPKISSYGRGGFVLIDNDDSFADDKELADLKRFIAELKERDFYATWFINPGTQLTYDQKYTSFIRDTLVDDVYKYNNGTPVLQIANHSMSHSSTAITSVGTLSCASCSNPRYRIANGKLEVDENNDNLVDYLSVQTELGKSILDLNTQAGVNMSTCTNWSDNDCRWKITLGADVSGNTAIANILVDSATEVDWTSLSIPIDLDDSDSDCSDGCSDFFKNEIVDAKSLLESIINGDGDVIDGQTGSVYQTRSFGNPFGTSSAGYEQAVKTSGHITHRHFIRDGSFRALNDFDLFNIKQGAYGNNFSGTEDEVRKKVGFYLTQAAQHGFVVDFLTHMGTYSESDFHILEVALDEIKRFVDAGAIQVVSHQQLHDIITDSPWTNNGGGVVTRTFAGVSDFTPLSDSPLVDGGNNAYVSASGDILNNPIYGTPDIGSYEYQPPHTIGTNEIDIAAGARIYGDGKFRDLQATSSNTADLSVAPESGNFPTFNSTDVRPEWLNIIDITWTNTGNHQKAWTESSSIGAINTLHTIGDLEANKNYNISVDTVLGRNIEGANGTTCAGGICKSNSEGKISFLYTGGYSEHDFEVIEGDNAAPSTTASINTGAYNSTQNLILTCDDGAGVGCDKTYYTTDDSTPTTSSTQYSTPIEIATATTLKFFSTDLNGNQEEIQTKTYTIDTTSPIITINTYTTETTDQDITVTASTNEGTLNTTTHTFTENGSFDFIATDEAGNQTTQTITITNIDKTPKAIASIKPKLFSNDNRKSFSTTLKSDKVKLKNTNPEIAHGKVQIKKGDRIIKEISVDENGKWSTTFSSKKFQLHYLNQDGTEIATSKEYELKIDDEKPKIKPLAPIYIKHRGSIIDWDASDNKGIDYYTVKFENKTFKVKGSQIKIPSSIKKGPQAFVITAYDKAGNKASRKGNLVVSW